MSQPKHDKSLDTLGTAIAKKLPQAVNSRSKSGGKFKYYYDEGDGTYIRTPRAAVINAAIKPHNWSITKQVKSWVKFILVDVIGSLIKKIFS